MALGALAIGGALVILGPTLTWSLWIARLVVSETSLAGSASAAGAVFLLRGRPGGLEASIRVASLLAFLVGLGPFVGPLAEAGPERSSDFSFMSYLTFGRPFPAVVLDRDRVLDPARPSLTADVYRGAVPAPRPFVLALHGGSWRGGDKGEGSHTWRYLAAAGYTVVDVRYGLAPEHPFPQGVGDVKCLLGRLRDRATEFGVDPARAALLGRSAGGQVALIAAYGAGDERLPPSCAVEDRPVEAVVSIYGPTDLVWGYRNPMVPDVIRGNESLRLYLGGSPEERPERYRLASALSWAHRRLPPTLLIHGSGDRLVSDHRAASAAAVPRAHPAPGPGPPARTIGGEKETRPTATAPPRTSNP